MANPKAEHKKNHERSKFVFIHTLVKSAILNTITCIGHSGRAFGHELIKSPDGIKDRELREIWESILLAYDNWLLKFEHQERLIRLIKSCLTIMFTIANEDWVYRTLSKEIYEEIGKHYVKNTMEEIRCTYCGTKNKYEVK